MKKLFHKLGKLGKLEVLDMSRNSLSGSVPPKLGNCSSFSMLVLSNMFDPYQDANGMKGDGLLDHLSCVNEDFIFSRVYSYQCRDSSETEDVRGTKCNRRGHVAQQLGFL